MKNLSQSAVALLLLSAMLVSGCTKPDGVSDTPNSTPTQVVLVSDSKVGALKEVGCGDTLKVVSVPNSKGDMALALTTLFTTKDPTTLGTGLSTASAFKDGYFSLIGVTQELIKGDMTYMVNLHGDTKVGLTGACDTPRFKNQIIETVRANAGGNQFLILLDGTEKNWECLGNESGEC